MNLNDPIAGRRCSARMQPGRRQENKHTSTSAPQTSFSLADSSSADGQRGKRRSPAAAPGAKPQSDAPRSREGRRLLEGLRLL